ncbi:MAG: hypothetical protein ACLQO7_08340 [Candidatus Bathyarchaeia archaeon]
MENSEDTRVQNASITEPFFEKKAHPTANQPKVTQKKAATNTGNGICLSCKRKFTVSSSKLDEVEGAWKYLAFALIATIRQ